MEGRRVRTRWIQHCVICTKMDVEELIGNNSVICVKGKQQWTKERHLWLPNSVSPMCEV